MSALFYVSGAIAIVAALLVVTRTNAMHALINLVVMFLAIASVFFTLGAPLVAAFQIVIYAGAIMVLFVFVVMLLDLGSETEERRRLRRPIWILPGILSAVLFAALIHMLLSGHVGQAGAVIAPKVVGISLFTDYLVGVELASVLLLAALVAALRFGLPRVRGEEE